VTIVVFVRRVKRPAQILPHRSSPRPHRSSL